MATSEAEFHRALRGAHEFVQATRLPKVTNFFFVLFLFGKEKGHFQTRIYLKK